VSDTQPIPVPDFLDVDEATVNASQALVTGGGGTLKPPVNCRVTKDDKSGVVYERWTEGAVIEATWREVTKAEKPEDRLLIAVIQMKVRAGFPNQHERTWSRYMLSPAIMAKQPPVKEGHTAMHDRSLGAIMTLLAATGYKPKTGGVTGKLLNLMFPLGKGNATAPICGKEVTVNFCNSDNTGKNAKTNRQTKGESFLPYAPPVAPQASEVEKK
jgi:hypothetical protein